MHTLSTRLALIYSDDHTMVGCWWNYDHGYFAIVEIPQEIPCMHENDDNSKGCHGEFPFA